MYLCMYVCTYVRTMMHSYARTYVRAVADGTCSFMEHRSFPFQRVVEWLAVVQHPFGAPLMMVTCHSGASQLAGPIRS